MPAIPKPRLTIAIPGMTSLDDAAEMLVLAAHEAQARIYCDFNSVELHADPMNTSRAHIIAQWDAAQAKRHRETSQPVTPDELDAAAKIGEPDLDLDTEVEALVLTIRTLAMLDDEQRQRVLRYCHQRFPSGPTRAQGAA